MTYSNRLLDTRICAWCHVGEVNVTTKLRKAQRTSRRYCSQACARHAGGITHDETWARRMQRASTERRRRKALEEAEAMLAKYPVDEAARRIRARGYQAGWKAGRRVGMAAGYREAKRAELAQQKRGRAA